MFALYTLALTWCSLAAARHVYTPPVILPRTVAALDAAAATEAQQRDDSATRAFSNAQITTADGRCLFVDRLSGDFRENLTPVQVAACGSTDGQGWDLVTAGKHNNVPGTALVVSALTNACLNFDPRRAAGNQVLLFSCGGRADGGGDVTNSQLFALNSTSGPLAFEPANAAGSCVTVKGGVLDIAGCDASDAKQQFTFGSAAALISTSSASAAGASTTVVSRASVSSSSSSTSSISVPSSCTRRTRTVVATVTTTKNKASSHSSASASLTAGAGIANGAAVVSALSSSEVSASVASSDSVPASSTSASFASSTSAPSPTSSSADSLITGQATAIAVPDTAVPVSRGGSFSPSAAAEANRRDDAATRAFSDVSIRAPNGQCLFVDPTAGDFRANLIPVSLVDCAGTPNEKWDVVTAGAHNDVPGTALIVSTLTSGCISFDGRRATNDTVNVFSCGGRADGAGETNADQLMPFIGALSFAFAPTGENNGTCILSGDGQLVSGACPTDGAQLFSVIP